MEQVKIKIFNIEFDTDGDNNLAKELSNEYEPLMFLTDKENTDNLEDEISDYISDETGYCHFGFEYEILN